MRLVCQVRMTWKNRRNRQGTHQAHLLQDQIPFGHGLSLNLEIAAFRKLLGENVAVKGAVSVMQHVRRLDALDEGFLRSILETRSTIEGLASFDVPSLDSLCRLDRLAQNLEIVPEVLGRLF